MTKKEDFAAKIAEILQLPQEGAQILSQDEQNALYATGYSLYTDGNYKDAAALFTKLVLTAPLCEKYWRGLASSEQMRKEYMASLHAWCMVVLLKDKDPLPHFHAGECYLSLKDPAEAEKAFNAAQKLLSPDSEEDRRLAEKIHVLKRIHFKTDATH